MTDGLKVLQVLGRSAGGIATHVADVVTALDGHGMTVDVAGPSDLPVTMPKEMARVEIPDGVRGHGVARRRLEAILEEGAYDVVHAHGLRAGIDASMVARRMRKHPVVTVHNLVRSEVAGPVRAVAYKASEPAVTYLAAKVFAVSGEIARALGRWTRNVSKVEVMHLGIGKAPAVRETRDDVRAALGIGPDTPLVVTLARLSAQKALDVMLRAVAEIPDAHLAVAGQGPMEDELRSLAAELAIAERVHFLGFVERPADHLAAADVFCLSSVWEGIPLAAQEAILLGVPVVATDVGGLSELVTDRVSGRLVPPGDHRALSRALSEALDDRVTVANWVSNARAHVASEFSTERMLTRLAGEYQRAR